MRLYLQTFLADERGQNIRNPVCHGFAVPAVFNYRLADQALHALLRRPVRTQFGTHKIGGFSREGPLTIAKNGPKLPKGGGVGGSFVAWPSDVSESLGDIEIADQCALRHAVVCPPVLTILIEQWRQGPGFRIPIPHC